MQSAAMRLQRVGIVRWDCRIWPLFLMSNTLVALMPRMARIQAHCRLTSCLTIKQILSPLLSLQATLKQIRLNPPFLSVINFKSMTNV